MADPVSSGTSLFQNLNPEKREKVFKAAVSEFASKGYRNASMNSVVKVAQISKGSLFQYFRTKRDLFDGIVEMAVNEVKSYLKGVREESVPLSFRERLEKLLRAGFEFIDKHPLLARIYFHLLQSGEAPFGAERIRRLHRLSDEFLAELIRQSIQRGELRRDVDVDRAAFLLNSLLESLLRAYYTEHLASEPGLYKGKGEELERWVAAFLGLVTSGLVQQTCAEERSRGMRDDVLTTS
jgi:AcrR family transcriptional regulator